jgi:hypothetical protein
MPVLQECEKQHKGACNPHTNHRVESHPACAHTALIHNKHYESEVDRVQCTPRKLRLHVVIRCRSVTSL